MLVAQHRTIGRWQILRPYQALRAEMEDAHINFKYLNPFRLANDHEWPFVRRDTTSGTVEKDATCSGSLFQISFDNRCLSDILGTDDLMTERQLALHLKEVDVLQ